MSIGGIRPNSDSMSTLSQPLAIAASIGATAVATVASILDDKSKAEVPNLKARSISQRADTYDELSQQVVDADRKIDILKSDIETLALKMKYSTATLPISTKSDEDIKKLYDSLHPKTIEFLKEISNRNKAIKKNNSTSSELTINAAPSVYPTIQQNRLNRVLGHLRQNQQNASISITPAPTAAITSNKVNSSTDKEALLEVLQLLDHPEISQKSKEHSGLEKEKDENKKKGLTVDKVVRERFILAIDGGGIRGKIPACVMEYAERRCKDWTGQEIQLYQLFDMMAGTSTGAILACGASVKGFDKQGNRKPVPFKGSELVKIYNDHGNEIFNKPQKQRYIAGPALLEGAPIGLGVGSGLTRLSRWHNHPYSGHWGMGIGLVLGMGLGALKGWASEKVKDYVTIKYTRDGLDKVVTKYFQDTKLNPYHVSKNNKEEEVCDRMWHENRGEKSPIHLIITTCKSETREPRLFCPQDLSKCTRFDTSDKVSIKDALLSSTAAPSYFPEHEWEKQKYQDGGICFNNPALLAYTMARKKWPDCKIHLLSLGTGYTEGGLTTGGAAFIAKNLIDALFQSQSFTTSRYLDTLAHEVQAPHKMFAVANALLSSTRQVSNQKVIDLKKVLDQISFPEEQMMPIPYKPLESYTRVDGQIAEKIQLDSVELLQLSEDPQQKKGDAFEEAANTFINNANKTSVPGTNGNLTKERVLLDDFLKIALRYHGYTIKESQ